MGVYPGNLESGNVFFNVTPKAEEIKGEKLINETAAKLKMFVLQMIPSRKWKDNHRMGENNCKLCLIRDWHPEYIEISGSSKIHGQILQLKSRQII